MQGGVYFVEVRGDKIYRGKLVVEEVEIFIVQNRYLYFKTKT
jgi:hypothetical protein